MSQLTLLLDMLHDPFELFPLQTVSRGFGNLSRETLEQLSEEAGPLSIPSPKYRSVKQEHDFEVMRVLSGSAFVLGQAAITQAVSIALRVWFLAGNPSWLPSRRRTIMSMCAPVERATGLSKIVLIDAVANYFKHHYEWPDNWVGTSHSQQKTIDIVTKLGMGPGKSDNVDIALQNLGVSSQDMEVLLHIIQGWREQLAEDIRGGLIEHGHSFPHGLDS